MAVGTDYNRQLLTGKDWFFSDLNRKLMTEFFKKNKLKMS